MAESTQTIGGSSYSTVTPHDVGGAAPAPLWILVAIWTALLGILAPVGSHHGVSTSSPCCSQGPRLFVASINSTTRSTFRAVAPLLEASVICGKEHRLPASEASTFLAAFVYKTFWAPANHTAAGSQSEEVGRGRGGPECCCQWRAVSMPGWTQARFLSWCLDAFRIALCELDTGAPVLGRLSVLCHCTWGWAAQTGDYRNLVATCLRCWSATHHGWCLADVACRHDASCGVAIGDLLWPQDRSHIDYFLVSARPKRVVGIPEVLVGILCPPHRGFETMARPRGQWVQVARRLRPRRRCRAARAPRQRLAHDSIGRGLPGPRGRRGRFVGLHLGPKSSTRR